MSIGLRQKQKKYGTLSVSILLIGLLLMVFMITTEGEPGALPLILIVSGTTWLILNKSKSKKYTNHESKN